MHIYLKKSLFLSFLNITYLLKYFDISNLFSLGASPARLPGLLIPFYKSEQLKILYLFTILVKKGSKAINMFVHVPEMAARIFWYVIISRSKPIVLGVLYRKFLNVERHIPWRKGSQVSFLVYSVQLVSYIHVYGLLCTSGQLPAQWRLCWYTFLCARQIFGLSFSVQYPFFLNRILHLGDQRFWKAL